MSAKPNGTFVWADLMPADQARAIAFYGDLAGWTAAVGGAEYGGYALAFTGGEASPAAMVAGINPAAREMAPVWTVYLATNDLGGTLASVIASGGEQLIPRMDIPQMGSMTICSEPAGATFGLWQPSGHYGFGVYGEPGSFCWAEVYSTDAPATREFFSSAFGLVATTLEESEAFTYYQMTAPGQEDATFGVMQIGAMFPAGTESSFAAYIAIADVDGAVERMASRGASLAQPPTDTPFGRLATLVDSEGATIKVIDPSRATASGI